MKSQMIQEWERLVESHIKSLFCFVESEKQICEKYIKSEAKEQGNSFNIFSIISDLYYRENFHSDLMRFLLDPKENHDCGMEFLRLFIDMLNSKGRTIDANNYDDAMVVREEGKIDILIKSDTSKRAIVIENKINNAGDMPRQLPRYFDYISPIYVIDAIVYLPLDKSKHPDTSTWSEVDKTNVNELLIEVPAYDKSGSINIVDNWLKPAVSKASNPDVLSFLRQYSKLIQILNKNNMDTVIMKEFYDELMKENHFQYALSIRNMLNDLPAYLESRILEKYEKKCSPFSNVKLYKEEAIFDGAIIGGIYLRMDIWCALSGYNVLFWTNDDQIEEERFFNLVNQIQSLHGFDRAMDCRNGVIKHFEIEREVELFSFIDSLKEDLKIIAEKLN